MGNAMATRNVAGLFGRPDPCTEFQLYVAGRNIVDFTEQKLLRYAAKTVDPQQKLVLMAMVDDYVGGQIAIAWKHGAPVYLRVTKEV